MSKPLFSLACGITKEVINSDWRTKIAASLKTAGDRPANGSLLNPGTLFRYHANELKMQFAGYLLLNDNLDEVNTGDEMRPPLARMSEEDWRWISEGDRLISQVNSAVLTGLSAQLNAKILTVCDPHFEQRLGKGHPDADGAHFSSLNSSIRDLANGFCDHPAVAFLKSAQPLLSTIEQENISALSHYVRAIVEEEPGRPTDEDIEQLRGEARDMQGIANLLGAVGAHIYSLRKALEVVDILIFDAFLQNQLVVVSADNCFSLIEKRDRLGRSVTVELQPNNSVLNRKPRDLIWLDLPRPSGEKISGLATIESERIEASQESGMTMMLELRQLDDWLNPYPGLCSDRILSNS